MDTTRPLRSLALTVLLLGTACAAAALAASPARPSPRQRANERAATRAATSVVRSASLPPGSRQVSRIPDRGAEKLLAHAPFTVGTPAIVYRHALWVAPRAPRAVFRWVQQHRAAGLHASGSGSEGSTDGNPRHEVRYQEWERGGGHGVLGSTLVVSTVPLSSLRTAVRVEGQSIWISPRPRGEKVPAGVAKIAMRITHEPGEAGSEPIEEIPPGGELVPPSNEGQVRSLTIDDPRRVSRITRLVDNLLVVQLGEILCPPEAIRAPGEPLPGTIHLRFETTAGKVLAEAIQDEDGGVCDPMKFSVRGRWMDPLEGGGAVVTALKPEIRAAS